VQKIGEMRDADGVSPVDLIDLEEAIRQGRVSDALQLRYSPWTGEDFLALNQIPELREALDSPNACFAQHVRSPGFPKASTTLSALMLLAGLLNLWLLFRGWKINAFEAGLMERYQSWLTGFEPLLLEGHWWSPWSAQFVHAGPGHFLPNLAVIVYAGYRVERALGATAFLAVSAAAVACGGVLVALFSGLPVMGSSILGYGFLGALLTIGFRFGDTIPKRHRRFYGYGNLLLFAFLFVNGLRMEQASHLGHLGGLIGGILAASAVRPAVCFRQPKRQLQRKKNLALAVALSLFPLVWVPGVHAFPALALGATAPVHLEKDGLRFDLLNRLSRFGGRLRGLPAWALGADSGEAIFVGLEPIPAGESMDADRFGAFWRQGETLVAQVAVEGVPLGAGWTVNALEIQDENGDWFAVVEHNLQRGQWLVRAGYRIRSNGVRPAAFRQKFFGAFLKTLVVESPPALVQAQHEWGLKKNTQTGLGLANQLNRMADWPAVEAIYKVIAERDPPQSRKSRRRYNRILRERISLWGAHPEIVPEGALEWVLSALGGTLTDSGVQKSGIEWLAANSRCNEAKMAYDRFSGLRPRLAANSGLPKHLAEVCVEQGGSD
jgi:rhomboid protease GluP